MPGVLDDIHHQIMPVHHSLSINVTAALYQPAMPTKVKGTSVSKEPKQDEAADDEAKHEAKQQEAPAHKTMQQQPLYHKAKQSSKSLETTRLHTHPAPLESRTNEVAAKTPHSTQVTRLCNHPAITRVSGWLPRKVRVSGQGLDQDPL